MQTASPASTATSSALTGGPGRGTGPGGSDVNGAGRPFGTRPRPCVPRSGQDSLVKAQVWTAVVEGACWVSSAPFVVEAAVRSSPLDLLVSL